MNAISRYFSFLFALVLILSSSACLKRKNNLISVTPALLERYSYKPGSYWIMRDSISARIDSFFITSSVTENTTLRQGLDVQNVVAQMAQISADRTDTSFWEWRYVRNQLSLKVQSKTYPGTLYPCGLMLYPPVITYTSFPLNSRYYADVNVSNTTDDSTLRDNNWLYINEADGIVKMRLNHPTDTQKHFVWELLRKNIVL